MRFKVIVFVGLCLALSSCRHGGNIPKVNDKNVEIKPSNEIRLENLHGANVSGEDDDFETTVEVKVGSAKDFYFSFAGTGDHIFYRGYINKTSLENTYQLYIQTSHYSSMFWNNARYLSSGGLKELPVKQIGADVSCSNSGCINRDDFILALDRGTLVNWSTENTKVRLASSKISGNLDLEVKGEDTKDFLNAMDEVTAYLKSKNEIASKPGQTIVK